MINKKSVLQFVLFGAVVFMLVAPFSVSAQTADTTAVIQDVEGLRIRIAQHTQDPTSKEVRLDVVVYSQITSDRVQVTWTVTGDSKLVSPTTGTASLSVQPDHYYTSTAVVLPKDQGNAKILVRVEAFKADGTYTSTASLNMNSLGGALFPVTTQYRIAQIVLILRGIAAGLLAIIIISIIGYFAFKRFKLWLNREN